MKPDTFPFDEMARNYDRDFSQSVIGRTMRSSVREILNTNFNAVGTVLELGCGTGEDALCLAQMGNRVVALDASETMVAVTREKVSSHSPDSEIYPGKFNIEQLYETREVFDSEFGMKGTLFQGILSDFGVLNCISDIPALSRGLGQCLAPGAPAVFCIMGPWVPWEWLYYGVQFKFHKAFRRFVGKGVQWRGLTIRYPKISTAVQYFSPDFQYLSVTGIGILVPPSYAENLAVKYPRIFEKLAAWERKIGNISPFPWFADHYILQMKRR